MKSLWFLVPAHGRHDIARVCLRQLRRTCDTLQAVHGIDAHAVVAAADANLDAAWSLGFGTIERANQPLGRKWNDCYELAADQGVDYVVPLGTDDWVDAAWIAGRMPRRNEIRCSRLFTCVNEDQTLMSSCRVGYHGGHGVRVIPTALLQPLDYRPADEDRDRAIDASVLRNLVRALGAPPKVVYWETHSMQLVDWKTDGTQLNSYAACAPYRLAEHDQPFDLLARTYPQDALDEMRSLRACVTTT